MPFVYYINLENAARYRNRKGPPKKRKGLKRQTRKQNIQSNRNHHRGIGLESRHRHRRSHHEQMHPQSPIKNRQDVQSSDRKRNKEPKEDVRQTQLRLPTISLRRQHRHLPTHGSMGSLPIKNTRTQTHPHGKRSTIGVLPTG
jgi:hypothetical protein